MRVAGIMSGTSLDGIDVAVVEIARRGGKIRVDTLAHSTTPYPAAMRARILAVSNAICHTGEISRLGFELAELYSRAFHAACRKAKIATGAVNLIGCHGQTIFHEGAGKHPNTLQIGEASVLAERTGIPVVSNFRARDIAVGGQGAPLVPLADYLLLRSGKVNRVALNIGGIANITVLPKNCEPDALRAFDTGPGNMVIDQLAEIHTNGKQHYDKDGAIAASGNMNRKLLDELMRDPWFRKAPPKSAGREQYGAAFVERLRVTGLPDEDLIATATAFTAATIALGIERFGGGTEEVIASGGGVHNRQLMAQLAAFLPAARITTTAEFGMDPDAKEAIAFALLAWRTWNKETGNIPSATGAAKAVVLGCVTH